MNERGGSGKSPDHRFSSQKNNQSKEANNPQQRVWDALERETRLNEEHLLGRISREEYRSKRLEVGRVTDEISKKGSDRDKLVLELYTETILQPAAMPVVVYPREMSLDEFQQFRSKVEPMSDEEIRDDIRKVKEQLERKIKKKTSGFRPPQGGIQV